MTVDDAALFIGRFDNGALANVEATRYAPGRKNHVAFEINGSKGSLCFDFEDMNRLKFCDRASLPDRQGFRDILVTQPGGVHPYIGQWWRAGHLLGYEHTFVHTVADFINACAEGRPAATDLRRRAEEPARVGGGGGVGQDAWLGEGCNVLALKPTARLLTLSNSFGW